MTSDDVFSVLADPTRRRILEALREGENSVGDLVQTLGASQPTVSKHLKVLREAGVLTMRADGQRRIYAVELGALDGAAEWLSGFGAEPVAGPAGAAGYKNGTAGGNGPATAPGAARPEADAAARALEAAAAYREAQQRQHGFAPGTMPAVAQRENPQHPAVVVPSQQLGRTVGRTVEQVTGRAQDLLERLQKPKFGRRK